MFAESTWTIKTPATANIAAGDTFTSSIKSPVGARLYMGHFDGTTAAFKFNGTMGPVILAKGTPDNFSTDIQKSQLCLDSQRFFSSLGYEAADVTAFGNWCNSSGVPKVVTTQTTLATGDRWYCPFTGNYLELQWNGVGTQTGFPPYTPLAHTRGFQANSGSGFELIRPEALEFESPKRWAVSGFTPNPSNNPNFFIHFLGADGLPNRWPRPIQFPYWYIASGTNAKTLRRNTVGGSATFVGDTHANMAMLPIDDGLLVAPVMHGNAPPQLAAHPAAGDNMFALGHLQLITDEANDELIETESPPWGSAYAGNETAFLESTKTYSILVDQPSQTRAIELSRRRVSQSSIIVATQYTHVTKAVNKKHLISGSGTKVQAYLQSVIPMSDGRVHLNGWVTHFDTSTFVQYWGILAPTLANWNDTSEWFAFDGTPLDGAGGNPSLGFQVDGETLAPFMLDENMEFFEAPPLPDDATGMDFVGADSFVYINHGGREGIAKIMRVSTANADRSRVSVNSGGGGNVPWDFTYLQRWEYDPAQNRFIPWGKFDITSIVDTVYGNDPWPQDTNFDTKKVAVFTPIQAGNNAMLVIVADPMGVALAANKSLYAGGVGYRLRGLLFGNMSGSDPTAYTELSDPILTLPTDNTLGTGMHAHMVGTGVDPVKSVVAAINGGSWNSFYGDRVLQGVDLENMIDEAMPPSFNPAWLADSNMGSGFGFGF
jgi:hypothetical protein